MNKGNLRRMATRVVLLLTMVGLMLATALPAGAAPYEPGPTPPPPILTPPLLTPDLTISSLVGPSSAVPADGRTVGYTIKVSNKGNRGVGDATVRLDVDWSPHWWDDGDALGDSGFICFLSGLVRGTLYNHATVTCRGGVIAPGSTATIYVYPRGEDWPGTFLVAATVDPLDRYRESNEDNNTARITTTFE